MPLTPLTNEQRSAAQAWLEALETRTRDRGAKLVRDRAVLDLESFKRGTGLRAAVLGTYRYTVRLRYDGERWTGECSCPVMFDCKHCAATMLAAFAEFDGPVVPPESRTGPA